MRFTKSSCSLFPRSFLTIAAALFLIGGAAPALFAVEPLGKAHVDKKVGFSIRVPKGWEFVASPDEERYIVGKFIAEHRIRTKGGEYIMSHQPEMRIIAFTPENKEIETSEREEEGLGGVKINYLTQKNPYRDFKEYVKRNERGFYFGEESDEKIKGVPCTFVEVIMEQNRPKLRRLACIYHLEDVDVAVYFDVLEDWYTKYEKLFKSSFKSFKKVRRDTAVDLTSSEKKVEEMTREEWIESKTKNLPKGWDFLVSKRHLVIYHSDKKFAGKVASFADALRNTVEKQFKIKKSKGKKDEGAPMPIIRICASTGEYNSYNDNSGGFSSYNAETKEVIAFDGTREGWTLDEVMARNVSPGICSQYLGELFPFAPADWYTYGMSYYYSCFKKKGSGCKFVKDTSYAINWLREAQKRGEIQTLRQLVDPGGKGIRSYEDYYKAGTFVCFLFSKEGRRKPWKGVGDLYFDNMKRIYDEMTGKMKDGMDDLADSDSEEEVTEKGEAFFKNYREFQKNLRQRTFDETFGKWKDTDWDKLERAWADWAV